ncbi:hypothetical protein Tco_1564047 [Tanacetum coccineum]
MPPEDEVLPAEEQPLPAAASPTADSLGYIPESDPEEDPTDYLADGGDDDDDESSDDDEDDDEDVEKHEDEDEDEEHPTLADSVPPPPIPPPPLPVSLPVLVSSPPLPLPSPPPTSPTYIEAPLGFRASRIRLRDVLPSRVHEIEVLEICLPLQKRLCLTAPTPRYEVGESSAAAAARQVGPAIAREDLYRFVDIVDAAPGCPMSRELDYGITDTWDDLVGAIQEIAPTTLEGINQRVTELATTFEQETSIMYSQMEDAQDDRSLLRGRVNRLFRDRSFHRRAALLIEEEARVSRVDWAQSMDASDKAHSEGMSLRTTVLVQQAEIAALRAADRAQQIQLLETLRLVKTLQTQVIALQGQQGPARGPTQPEIPKEASSSS